MACKWDGKKDRFSTAWFMVNRIRSEHIRPIRRNSTIMGIRPTIQTTHWTLPQTIISLNLQLPMAILLTIPCWRYSTVWLLSWLRYQTPSRLVGTHVEKPEPTMNTLGQRETWRIYEYVMFWVTPPTLGAPNVIYLPPLLPPTHPAAVSKKNEDKQTLSKSKMEWRSGEPGTPLNHIFYTQNLYVPLYLIVINVHPERGYIPSRRPLNKPIIVSNNFRGL